MTKIWLDVRFDKNRKKIGKEERAGYSMLGLVDVSKRMFL